MQILHNGQVLAVKGLGGYHLAVDARSQAAAARLRAAKHREDKPFAVMVPDVAAARELCEVGELAEALLTSPRRPIVLLPRRAGAGQIADAVAPGNRQLGLMLPYTPLHHLLLRRFPHPMVLTSGNVSDEPIAYQDGDALDRLGGIADAFLTHDRPIHIRTDDSVVRPFRGRQAVLRRSRGYAPQPLAVRTRFRQPVLACGAELKNTFCLGREQHAFLSQHIGDLENYETLRSFTEGIEHFQRLFDVTPELVAHDLHPEYLSTKYALDRPGTELAGVQHHHAHIASCLADNEADGPVIGVAFDGTGFGPDGTIWGGEFLLADLAVAERGGALAGLPMPGGAAAIRQPWRMAAVYLDAAFPGALPDGLAVAARNSASWADVLAMARRGVNSPVTSSAGRLFDAVAALLGVRDTINYEGQAAVELEQLAAAGLEHPGYPARITPGPPFTAAGRRPGPGGGRGPAGRAAAGCDQRPVPPRDGRPDRGRLPAAARVVRAGHRRAVRRRVPEPAAARDGRRPAGSARLPGADPLPGATQRRRDQPGSGRRGRGPLPLSPKAQRSCQTVVCLTSASSRARGTGTWYPATSVPRSPGR